MGLPYMPMFWGDYWRDTTHLSDAEHVSYLRLISHYWQHGCLPQEDSRLARIAGRSDVEWADMKPMLQAFFKQCWTHARIDRELQKQKSLHDTNVDRAKKAAATRWNRNQIDNEISEVATDAPSITQAYSEQCSTNAIHSHNHIHNHINKSVEKNIRSQARGTRLEPEWFPSEHLDEKLELEKFRDYWIAQPGQKGVKTDWDATWRNWVRRAAEGGPPRQSKNRIENAAREMLDAERNRNQSSWDNSVLLPFSKPGGN
jgi:uncharacterized protein YdaU (DUF1376 family)